MGELKKRGQIWWVRYYRNGRRHEESSHSDIREDAVRLLKVREGDVARGLPVTPKIGRLRFDEAAEDVLNDYRVNGKRSLDDVQRRSAEIQRMSVVHDLQDEQDRMVGFAQRLQQQVPAGFQFDEKSRTFAPIASKPVATAPAAPAK